jgi:flagellar biogenesis protein FliO
VVRRVIEEDVATPTSTAVVDGDGSWIGRTIVTLVILALLVVGAVWLVRSLSNDNTPGFNPNVNVTNNNPGNNQPSAVVPS